MTAAAFFRQLGRESRGSRGRLALFVLCLALGVGAVSAVAGFSQEEISIEAHRNVLTVKGERSEQKSGEGSELLYRGIASRSFERRFQLADHVDVVGANLKNGLLHIDLKRNIPEEMKPRKIAITAVSGNTAKQIEGQSVN